MGSRTAILAGHGGLPREIARADRDALFVTFAGVDVDVPAGMAHLPASFEKLGALFAGLRQHAVGRVVFAGAITRPALNPAGFEVKTVEVVPAVMAAMGRGDDALLGAVIAVFEAEGFQVGAAHKAAPGLVLEADTVWGRPPTGAENRDAARAADILRALAPQDVAQACVVEGGQCLGIETLQGTDAMLRFVAGTGAHLRRGAGILMKAPKAGQDLRVDAPTIGPDTVRVAAAAGLAGIFIEPGRVIVLERKKVLRLLEKHGLFLVAR